MSEHLVNTEHPTSGTLPNMHYSTTHYLDSSIKMTYSLTFSVLITMRSHHLIQQIGGAHKNTLNYDCMVICNIKLNE